MLRALNRRAMKAKVILFAIFFAAIPVLVSANSLPNGLVFRVIIEDQQTEVNEAMLQDFQPVNYSKTDQIYTYELGAYKDFIHVQKAKNEVKELGFQKADIIAYFNNKPVSMDDAFVLMDDQNSVDKCNVHLSENQIEEMLAEVEKPNFYYTIQVAMFNPDQVDNFFEFPRTIHEKVVSRGHDRYTYGQYYAIGDARSALQLLKDYGLESAFIIAYDDVERIPLARAIDLEQKYIYDALASE